MAQNWKDWNHAKSKAQRNDFDLKVLAEWYFIILVKCRQLNKFQIAPLIAQNSWWLQGPNQRMFYYSWFRCDLCNGNVITSVRCENKQKYVDFCRNINKRNIEKLQFCIILAGWPGVAREKYVHPGIPSVKSPPPVAQPPFCSPSPSPPPPSLQTCRNPPSPFPPSSCPPSPSPPPPPLQTMDKQTDISVLYI